MYMYMNMYMYMYICILYVYIYTHIYKNYIYIYINTFFCIIVLFFPLEGSMVALPRILRCHGDPDVVISVDGNEILHQKDGWKPMNHGMFTINWWFGFRWPIHRKSMWFHSDWGLGVVTLGLVQDSCWRQETAVVMASRESLQWLKWQEWEWPSDTSDLVCPFMI